MDVMVGSLRGLNYSVLPMVVSLVGACGLRLVWIATVFQMPEFHTVQVVYLSYPITWIITLSTHILCYCIIKRRLTKKLALQPAVNWESKNLFTAVGIQYSKTIEWEAHAMKIVVVKTPKLLTGIFRLVFKVKRAEPESDSWTEMNIGKKHCGQFDHGVFVFISKNISICRKYREFWRFPNKLFYLGHTFLLDFWNFVC